MLLCLKLRYRLGLRKAYTRIDRMHYLKRLGKGKHPTDDKYFASRDPEQFVPGSEVCITEEFRGIRVAFLCNPRHHFERLAIRQGFSGHAVLEHMAAWARPVTIFIDVGANVGVYSVPLAFAFPDLFATDGRRVGFIKIDVQGAELRVLHGARKLIVGHKPVILFEHEDSHFESSGQASEEKAALDVFFASQEYRCFYASRYDPKLLFPVDRVRPLHGDVLALPLVENRVAS